MGHGRRGTPPNPSHEIDVYTPFTGWSGGGGGFITPRRNFATASDGGCFAFGCTSYIWLAGGYGSDGTPLSSTEVSCQGPTPTPTATATATATVPPSPTPTPSACTVNSPMCGIIVVVPPTDFIIEVSDPVDPVTVQASDLMVNGTPASAFIITNGNTTITFHFNMSPVVGPTTPCIFPLVHLTAGRRSTSIARSLTMESGLRRQGPAQHLALAPLRHRVHNQSLFPEHARYTVNKVF